MRFPSLKDWGMAGGGTGASEGKHSYDLYIGKGLQFMISPFTTRSGRHAGYVLRVTTRYREIDCPQVSSGLWHAINPDGSEGNLLAEHTYRSPQAAQTAAKKFFERYCGSVGGSHGGKRRGGGGVLGGGAFVTSFCNFPHSLKTGRPIGHECYILPVKGLWAERDGRFDEAQNIFAEQRGSRVAVRGRGRPGGKRRKNANAPRCSWCGCQTRRSVTGKGYFCTSKRCGAYNSGPSTSPLLGALVSDINKLTR